MSTKEFKANSVAGRYWYLDHVNWGAKEETEQLMTYYLVEYRGSIRPVYFWKYGNWWIEYPCILRKIIDIENQTEPYLFEIAAIHSKKIYRDGQCWKIESFPCSPFLPEEMTFLQIMSESECVDWMLAHKE